MWESRVEIDVQSPPSQVFERLKDFSRHSDFSEGLVKIEQMNEEPVEVGARFRSEEAVPARFVSFCEITALEPPNRIAWKAWVEGVMRTEWEYRLREVAGGTHLEQVSRWHATGLMGFLILNFHRKRNAPRENRRSLERIKAVLEAEALAA